MLLPLNNLVSLLSDFGGSVEFKTPCTIKMSPHSYPVKVFSLEMKDGDICAKTETQEIKLEKPSEIANTLIQRLKLMKHESF